MESTAYREGRAAFAAKVKLKDCPYKGTRGLRQEDWEFGWRDARSETAKSKGGNQK